MRPEDFDREWIEREREKDSEPINAVGVYASGSEVHHAIAIGNYATATKDHEFVLRLNGVNFRTVMTPKEYEVVSRVLKRALTSA